MNLPNRHRNHEIQELSERYFKSIIPISWVVNPFYIDYGTDYNCEISKDGDVTGMNFSVQLKGKEKETNKNEITVSKIKRTTINRWLYRLEPTMIIVYLVDENEAYWIWFESNTVDLTLENSNFTIKLPRENKLSKINWDVIRKYIEEIFSRKKLLYEYPNLNNENKKCWQLYFEGNYGQALPLLKDISKKENDALILNAIAICEYQQYHYQDALIMINKVLNIRNDDSIYLNKASILTEQGFINNDGGKISEAISIYQSLINKGNISYSLFYNYASALIKLGEYDLALIQFKKAILLNPNVPEVWNNIANVYQNLKQHSLEMECYDKALLLNPNFAETLFSKGSSLYINFNKTDDGLELMLRASEISTRHEIDFPYLFFWISEAYSTKTDWAKAEEWNKKGLDIFSTDKYLLLQKERIINKTPRQ